MLEKNIFRTDIKKILLDYMIRGKIIPGNRISLPQLAKDLDVSVTPIREALTQLSEIGIVTYIANRGFFVTELSENEALEIFETISILESEAIKNSKYSKAHLNELERINKDFKKSKKPTTSLELDMKFHRKLIENYSNNYIQKIIEDIRIRVTIYELQFMKNTSINDSAEMHSNIILSLKEGKPTKAIKILKANWQLSIDIIINNYQTQEA